MEKSTVKSTAKNTYVEAAEAYLEDAEKLMDSGGHPPSIISQCWMAVSECVKALLLRKGQVKVYDHRQQGELLLRLYPEETGITGVYSDIRRLHRETYDSPLALTKKDAALVIEDARKILERTKTLVK